MYIFQNALQNLVRNKGRNILLAAITLAIITTTVVALIINNTASALIDDYQGRFGSRVNIVLDNEQVMNNMSYVMAHGRPELTAQQSIAFSGSDHVLEFEMSAFQGAFSDSLRSIDAEFDSEFMTMFGGGGFGARGGGHGGAGQAAGMGLIIADDGSIPNIRLYGNNWDDFVSGERSLIEGRMPEDGEALVSSEFAELNGLSIGDEIEMQSIMTSTNGGASRYVTHNLTIVGIYFDMTAESAVDGLIRISFTNRRNEVLTTLDTIIAPLQENDGGIIVNAVYYLREPGLLPYFDAELRSLGLHSLFTVTTDEAEYNALLQPILGLRDITLTFMIIVLALGGIVLALLSSIAIRERKYEIGVLRAMGMKKKKVAFGLWAEMLVITGICLVIGLSVGTVVAQPISDTLLAAQVESINEQADDTPLAMHGRFVAASASPVEPLSELTVTLGVRTALEIIGISLVLATLAGLVSILKITKYEPIKILQERG